MCIRDSLNSCATVCLCLLTDHEVWFWTQNSSETVIHIEPVGAHSAASNLLAKKREGNVGSSSFKATSNEEMDNRQAMIVITTCSAADCWSLSILSSQSNNSNTHSAKTYPFHPWVATAWAATGPRHNVTTINQRRWGQYFDITELNPTHSVTESVCVCK